MRHMSSACRCSSTDWPGWKGGSNQKQRSVGKSAVHRDVGDQEAVAEHAALALLAQQLAQVGARAVAGGDASRACSV